MTSVNTSLVVSGYCSGSVWFFDQIVSQANEVCGTGPISVPGDSGSPVLNLNNQIVGLNFAGGGSGVFNIGIHNTIQNVLSVLDLSLGDSDCDCPITTAVASTETSESTLETLHRLRDRRLSNSRRGRRYIDLYYQNSGEATALLLNNLDLLFSTQDLLARIMPAFRSLVSNGSATLTQDDLKEIHAFLRKASSGASKQLRDAVREIQKDLRNRHALAELGIQVK